LLTQQKMSSVIKFTLCAILVSLSLCVPDVPNTTPHMGFNSWSQFYCKVDCKAHPDTCISEKLYMRIADAMVEHGYRDAGYVYVNIDDCWSAGRDPVTKRLVADPERFPSGIPALADYMHQRGLKLGIYGDAGTHTCGGYAGTWGYEELDAQTWKDWGISYVKLDGCYLGDADHSYEEAYINFGNALKGKGMIYSCSWPAYLGNDESKKPFVEMYEKANCNSWRNWDDINNSWGSIKSIINHWATYNDALINAPKGAWNDSDMILGGNTSNGKYLSENVAKMQMTLWSIIAAPLLLSSDLTTVPENYKNIVTNKNVLSVSQDPAGIKGGYNGNGIWERKLHNGVAVAFANLEDAAITDSEEFVFTAQSQIAGCYDVWGDSQDNLCAASNQEMSSKDWSISLSTDRLTVRVTAHNIESVSHRFLRIVTEAAHITRLLAKTQ